MNKIFFLPLLLFTALSFGQQTQIVGTVTTNQGQVNGTTTSTGNGTTDAGTTRVSISNDSTGQVAATKTTPGDATSNTSVPGFQNYTMIFNGSTWDRLKGITGQTGLLAVGTVNSGSNPGDATSQMFTQLNNAGNSQLTATGVGYLFNNSTYDRARSGASANLPNLIGSTLTANVTVDPCQSSAVTKSSAAVNISSATTTLLVALASSKIIYVCGFAIDIDSSATSAATFKFVYGTQTTNPCDTGATNLTGTFGTQTATGSIAGIHAVSPGGFTQFATIASNQLCLTTAGTTVAVQGYITYVQQ